MIQLKQDYKVQKDFGIQVDLLEYILELDPPFLVLHLEVNIILIRYQKLIIFILLQSIAALFFLTYESSKNITSSLLPDQSYEHFRYMISAGFGETVSIIQLGKEIN